MMEESVSTSSGMDSGATSSTTSSPSSVSTSESRPSSFGEAFEMVGAADTPDPGASRPDPTTPAPAIAEPGTDVGDTPVSEATSAKGPIPFDRHEAILQNTRQKTAQDVVSQVQQRFGGAIEFQQRLASDPVATLTQLVDEAVSDPQIGQQFVSHLARTLSARRKQAITPIDTEVGPVYTADQVQQLMDQKMAERLALIEQERQKAAQLQALEQQRQQTRETVVWRLSEWQKQPGFKDHEPAIAAKQAELVKHGMDTWSALGLAYSTVVIPTLKAQQANQFVQDAVRKAQASTNNPATVAPISQPRPRSFAEAFAQVRKQA